MNDQPPKPNPKESRDQTLFAAGEDQTRVVPQPIVPDSKTLPLDPPSKKPAYAKQDVFTETLPPDERPDPPRRKHHPQPVGAAAKQDLFTETLPPDERPDPPRRKHHPQPVGAAAKQDLFTETLPFTDEPQPPSQRRGPNQDLFPDEDFLDEEEDSDAAGQTPSPAPPKADPDRRRDERKTRAASATSAPTAVTKKHMAHPSPQTPRSQLTGRHQDKGPDPHAPTAPVNAAKKTAGVAAHGDTDPTSILSQPGPPPESGKFSIDNPTPTNTSAQGVDLSDGAVRLRQEHSLEDMIGRRIGAYVIEEILGRGGMGAVYLATRSDDELKMTASVKLIHRRVASEDMLENFRRERQILADLRHPHICALLDGGTTQDGYPYFLMEHIQGRTIDRWCKEHRPSLLELIRMFSKIVSALAFAHAAGITHRDIKPGNLLVTHEGEPKLLDFGIAGLVDKETGIVQSGFVAMTPEYASPEQLYGEPLSPRTDIYSLGMLFLEILLGERPRNWSNRPQDMVRTLMAEGLIARADPQSEEPVVGEPIPEVLGYMLRTMLAEDVEKRYPGMKEVAEDLDRALVKLLLDSSSGATGERIYDAVPWYHPGDLSTVLQHMSYLSESEALRLWFDHWDVTAGSTVITSFIAALKRARTCLVYIGAEERYPWQTNVAVENALTGLAARGVIRIIPVLLPGAVYPKRQSELPAFVRGRTWFSFDGVPLEDGMERLISGILGQPVGRDTISGPTICPFRGLEVFRPEDRKFFHGREALTQQLLNNLEHQGFQAVVGPSGSGKSSVVQAGVIPQLRDMGHMVALFTPGALPIEELAFALRRQIRETLGHQLNLLSRLRQSEEALFYLGHELVADLDDKRLFLVIDQFEEVFTMAEDPSSRDAFIRNLCYTASRADSKISIIITMRSDFIGKAAGWPDLNSLISDSFLQVGPMTRLELERAVEEPARLGNLRLERGLLDRILDEVTGAATELPLLEHALLELYERRRGNMLTMHAYTEIGGIQGALARRAETEYEALDPDSRDLLRRMFVMSLVTPGQEAEDTRRHATREELLALGKDRGQIEALLQRMTKARLLTAHHDAVRNEDIVHVAHEALIRRWERIRAWMDEGRELSRAINNLRVAADNWEESGRDKDLLPRGGPLQRLIDLREQECDYLGATELEYVDAGEAQRDAQLAAEEAARQEELRLARQQTLRTRIAAGVFILMVTGFAAAIWKESKQTQAAYNRAEVQRTIAEKEREAAEQTANFLKTIFSAADRSREGDVSAGELLSEGRRKLDQEPEWLKKGLLPVIASAYRGLGDLDTARELIGEADAMLKPGDEPKVRALVLGSKAIIETELGNLEPATEAAEAALGVVRQSVPPETFEYKNAVFAASRVYFVKGELERAEQLARELIDLKINHPSPSEDPSLAKEYEDLAIILHRRGNAAEAETYLVKSLEMRQENMPENQAAISRVLRGLAEIYLDQGLHEKAEPVYRKILAADRALLGEGHPRVLATQNSLALSLKYQNRLEESEAVFRQALESGKATYGAHHPRVAALLGNLAGLKFEQGDYQAAEAMQEEALAIKRENLGERHYSVGTTLLFLATIHIKKRELQRAEERARLALAIYEESLGPDHPFVISALNTLAAALVEMSRYEEAEALCQRAQKIADAKLTPDHPTRHQLNSTHGLVLAGLGRLDQAEAMMLESIQALGRQNPTKANVARENLIRAYELEGRNEDAAKLRGKR